MTPPPSPLATPLPWDLVADAYTEEIVPMFERFAADALQWAQLQPDEAVLDVAAGPGTLALLAARRGAKVSALDFSANMVAHLTTRASMQNLRIDAREGDGQALPYADHSFDAAFSMFGLMFFPDRHLGFTELKRVLRPGGRAIVSSWVPMDRVPLLGEFFKALRAELPDLPLGDGRAPLSDADSFTRELRAAGFRHIGINEVHHSVDVPSVRAFVDSTGRSNAPMVLLKKNLPAEKWRTLNEGLVTRLTQTFGAGPLQLTFSALLGKGTA